MKKATLILAALPALLLQWSCKDGGEETMTNYLTLTAVGETTMTEDDTTGLTVRVEVAYALNTQTTITLSLSGDDKRAVRLAPAELTIAAGQKTATTRLRSNMGGVLVSPENVTVAFAAASDANIRPMAAAGLTLTVRPATTVPTLTDAQLALVEGYKTRYNFDLTRLLGQLSVRTVITWGDEDKATENNGEASRTIEGRSVVTLSEHSTAETPMLKFVSNPLGMESFMYEKLKANTVEDNEYFLQQPVPKALFGIVGYNAATETFSAQLDSVRVGQDGTIGFTAPTIVRYGDEPMVLVPFTYNWSVWDRLNGMRSRSVNVDEGETTASYTIQQLFDDNEQEYFNPAFYLGISKIDSDDYDNTPNMWVAPQASADFGAGTMTFTFAWDYGGGALSDYVRVDVTYTMHR